jgi:hypothetical protein
MNRREFIKAAGLVSIVSCGGFSLLGEAWVHSEDHVDEQCGQGDYILLTDKAFAEDCWRFVENEIADIVSDQLPTGHPFELYYNPFLDSLAFPDSPDTIRIWWWSDPMKMLSDPTWAQFTVMDLGEAIKYHDFVKNGAFLAGRYVA